MYCIRRLIDQRDPAPVSHLPRGRGWRWRLDNSFWKSTRRRHRVWNRLASGRVGRLCFVLDGQSEQERNGEDNKCSGIYFHGCRGCEVNFVRMGNGVISVCGEAARVGQMQEARQR